MLTQTQTVDSITVDAAGILSVRHVITILEDGRAISAAFHRETVPPGSDLTGRDARVVAVATAVWTPEVLQAYQDSVAGDA